MNDEIAGQAILNATIRQLVLSDGYRLAPHTEPGYPQLAMNDGLQFRQIFIQLQQ